MSIILYFVSLAESLFEFGKAATGDIVQTVAITQSFISITNLFTFGIMNVHYCVLMFIG